MKKILPLAGLLLISHPAIAENFDARQIFFGGGIGINDANFGDDAVGFQIFAGLPIPVSMQNLKLSAEVGYMDSGDFDNNTPFGNVSAKANGIWGTAVAEIPVQNNLNVIGRLGYDFGDDDGIMIGAGIGLPVASKMDLRFEYVIRDNIDSLQANLVIRQ